MFGATLPVLAPENIRDAFLRKIITEEEEQKLLYEHGFTDLHTRVIRGLYWVIPPIQDLIRMMVRDVWNETVVKKYGYDEDYPPEIERWVEMQGLRKDWARRYWRAHWELPSPTMVYEMLHRGVITKEEMEELLRIADYPKGWRDRMIAISYEPYTRVDVRRMYQLGILSRDQVKRAYKDIGYDDEHAENLTKFTESLASTREKDLSRSDLVTAYKDHLIDRQTLIYNLELQGYDHNEAQLIASRADYDIAKDRRKELIDYYKTLYLYRIRTKEEIVSYMIGDGFSADEIGRIMTTWAVEQNKNIKLPDKSDLVEFLKAGTIDSTLFEYKMIQLGYTRDDIALYVKAYAKKK